jgi:hypothetical protein
VQCCTDVLAAHFHSKSITYWLALDKFVIFGTNDFHIFYTQAQDVTVHITGLNR